MTHNLGIFFSKEETGNYVWFKIHHSDTPKSQADIVNLFASENVDVRYGYIDNTEYSDRGKYVLFALVKQSVDINTFLDKLEKLDVVLNVEYDVMQDEELHSLDYPLQLLGERAIITRATTFVDVIHIIKENVSDSSGLLMMSGLNGGIHAARYIKTNINIDKNNLINILKELVIAAGWGRLDMDLDFETLNGRIYFMNCFIAEYYGKSEIPVCEYVSGFFSGYITEALNEPVHVREIRCKSMNHDVCEHIISKAPHGMKPEHILRGDLP